MHTRVAVSRPTSINTTDRTDLERADKNLDTSNLILLAIHQAPKKRRPDPHDRLVPRHGRLEHRLENRPSLNDVELGAVETPRRRLEQSRLEQLDRRRDAKQRRELYPIVPRTVTRQHLLPPRFPRQPTETAQPNPSAARYQRPRCPETPPQPAASPASLTKHAAPRGRSRDISGPAPVSLSTTKPPPEKNSHPDRPTPLPPRYPLRPSPPPG